MCFLAAPSLLPLMQIIPLPPPTLKRCLKMINAQQMRNSRNKLSSAWIYDFSTLGFIV